MNVKIRGRLLDYIKANFSFSEFAAMAYVSILLILIYDLLAWWLYMIVAIVLIGIAAVNKWKEYITVVSSWDTAVEQYVPKEAIEIDMYRILGIYKEFQKNSD